MRIWSSMLQLGQNIYDIRMGDDPATAQETGRLFVGPTATLSQSAFDDSIPAQAIHVEAVTTNIFVEGATFATDTSILMQSDLSDASKGPFRLTTDSESTGESSRFTLG